MHGSNRLGGNSLSDLLVFGKRAGEYAALYAADTPTLGDVNSDEVQHVVQESLQPFDESPGENPYTLHEELRTVMQNLVGIVRTDEDLRSALQKLDELRARSASVRVGGNIQYNPGWHLALDLKNMVDISEAVTRAALARTESRGGHTREDFPASDDEWGRVNNIVRQADSGIEVVREPLPELPDEVKDILAS